MDSNKSSLPEKYSDMPTEMGSEAVDIITMATDKFHATKNYEVCVCWGTISNISISNRLFTFHVLLELRVLHN